MIQPLDINSLFDILEGNKKTDNKNVDFLFELLKNIDDKDFIKDFIKHSNIDEKEKNQLLDKLLKNFKENSLKELSDIQNIGSFNKLSGEILPLKDLKKEIIKISLFKTADDKKINLDDLKEIKYKDKKEIKSKKISLKDLLNSKEDKIEKLPVNLQIEVVKEIKNILISKSKSDSLINKLVNTEEFKKVTNIKDLVTLTKKFDLNLKKIVISQEKIQKQPVSIDFPKITAKNFENKNIKINSKPLEDIKTKKIDLTSLIKESHKKVSNERSVAPLQKQEKKDFSNQESFNIGFDINYQFKQKIIHAKQSINHFVSSLKEAVENYKPPITKLSLELHPKELGKVEVVIKQQGDNLNIQINTQNQTTINFLTTQQQELKNSLVNMGFTNINMNFNSNDQNRRQNKQNNFQKISEISNDEDELIIDFTYKYA